MFIIIVRWKYAAKNHTELTVQKGDEVEIIEPGSKFKVLQTSYNVNNTC